MRHSRVKSEGRNPNRPRPRVSVFVLQSYPLGKPRKLSRQSPGVSRLFRCGSDLRSDGSRSLRLRSLGAGETPRQRPGQPSDWRSDPRLDLSRYRGWAESHLATRRRNDARKQAIVVRLRNETTMPVKWIPAWVQIGTRPMAATNLNPRGPTNQAHNSNSNLRFAPCSGFLAACEQLRLLQCKDGKEIQGCPLRLVRICGSAWPPPAWLKYA